MRPVSVFALGSTRELGAHVAEHVGVALAPLEERDFEDGEHKVRPLASVRNHDAYVIHSLYGEPAASANDKLVPSCSLSERCGMRAPNVSPQ